MVNGEVFIHRLDTGDQEKVPGQGEILDMSWLPGASLPVAVRKEPLLGRMKHGPESVRYQSWVVSP